MRRERGKTGTKKQRIKGGMKEYIHNLYTYAHTRIIHDYDFAASPIIVESTAMLCYDPLFAAPGVQKASTVFLFFTVTCNRKIRKQRFFYDDMTTG